MDWKNYQKWPLIEKMFEPRPRVAVIRMSGVIADTAGMHRPGISYARYAPLVERAFKTPHLDAVALVINSPGGSPGQCALLSNLIRNRCEDKGIKVYAFVEDLAASGGYWLAAAADEIYAQETSLLGSIGVISASFGLHDLIRQYGIERRVHTSGTEKSFMDPFMPEESEDVQRLKTIQGDIHDQFKSWVESRRGDMLATGDTGVFEGRVFSGREAYETGLIDGFGELRSFFRDEYGEDHKLVDLSPGKGLLAGLTTMKARGRHGSLSNADDWIGALEDRLMWSRFGV